jgi:DNA-binding Lrp family transcriptional regulator
MKQFAKWANMFGETTASIPNSEMLVGGVRSIAEDVDPESIDVSSFEVHDEINKDFWNQPEDRLDPEIREKLLAIAQDFYNSLEVGDAQFSDITFTGSLAALNYSKFSDVDLHILVDFSDVDDKTELVREYFNAMKSVWNRLHDILIKGYEVEVYVQDINDPHEAQGLYSVLNNEWIKFPTPEKSNFDKDNVKKKAASLMDQIDRVTKLIDEKKYEEAELYAEKLKVKIRKMRKTGLETIGAYSVENLAFKVLRRNDYLEKLSNAKREAYDSLHSLK